MTGDIYGNVTYPDSRRMRSRPYGTYYSPYKDSDVAMKTLRSTLHDVGEALIGKPFYVCCDIDKLQLRPAYFSTPFWNEERVIELGSRKDLRQGMPPDVIQALDNIIVQCTRYRDKVAREHTLTSNPYDVPALIRDFKVLWQHDVMIDPRFTHAEELFFCQKEDSISDHFDYSHYKEKDSFGREACGRLKATLQWMAQPDNAERLAVLFLYSRLSQHFGEQNDRSLLFARMVASDIDGLGGDAISERLRSVPEAYWRSSVGTTAVLDKKGGLANSAQAMTADYLRLRDGSWATAELEKIRQLEQVVKPVVEPAPVSVPAPTPAPATTPQKKPPRWML